MLQKFENITFNELPQALSQLMKDVNELKSLLQTVHDAKAKEKQLRDRLTIKVGLFLFFIKPIIQSKKSLFLP